MARPTSLPRPRLPDAAPATPLVERAATRPDAGRVRLALVLLIALCQGAIYLCLLPPWQHYDEPTHFEYAWLIANRPGLPQPGDEDRAMRRELATTMLEHRFYWNLPKPNLQAKAAGINVGISELGHPPAYYLLVSLPLRAARQLDLVSQLYLARSVSLILFLMTIAIAAGLVADLTPPGHDLRWAAPLAMALIPPFVDLMTAVNNDVGAVAVLSLFLWGAVRTIRAGLTWRRAAWIVGAALLAALTKNTAAIALPLALLVILIAFWLRRRWRWRWLALTTATAVGAALALTFGWGDAAYWYRGVSDSAQASATRIETAAAPLGSRALLLEAPAGGRTRMLINPIVRTRAPRLAGHTVTAGGWLWADRPAVVATIGLEYTAAQVAGMTKLTQPISATTTPTFVAWTLAVPEQAGVLHYIVTARAPAGAPGPARLFLDGALLVDGAFPAGQPPTFGDAAAQSGTWAGRPFANLVRNPSAEDGWPRLRHWLDQALEQYIHRSPSQSLAALLDTERLGALAIPILVQPAIDSFVESFAWNNVRLNQPIVRYIARGVALLALLGCLAWLLRRRERDPSQRPAIVFLALVGLLVWANTILRPLPLLDDLYIVPAARYTFPAIIATTLAVVGGVRALAPARLRRASLLGLVAGLIWLNAISIQTIWSFYASLPTS